jgi:tetratricopeptide (TPR) repeat protein
LWFVVGRLTDADRWLEMVLDATANDESVRRVRALYGRALIGHARASLERAIAFDVASLTLAERLGDQRGIGDACNHMAGMIALTTGDGLRSVELVERAIEAYTAVDDRHGVAESLLNRASLTFEAGRFDNALADGQQVLDYCRAEGKDVLRSNTLHGVAGIAALTGQHELAIELLREALELSRRLGYDIFLSSNIAVLDSLLVEAGQYEDALRLAEFTREFSRNRTAGGDVSDPFQRVDSDRVTMLANLTAESAERAMSAGIRMTPSEAVDQGLALLTQLSF